MDLILETIISYRLLVHLIKFMQRNDLLIVLKMFLSNNKQIDTIYFHLDNDKVSIGSTRKMLEILSKDYYCFNFQPTNFKDVNEELKDKLNKKGINVKSG